MRRDTKKQVDSSTVVMKTKIADRTKRINHKSKRLRNLIKKAIELSLMCDLDISMIVRDREIGKYTKYQSGNEIPEGDVFTPEIALDGLNSAYQRNQKNLKTYTNEDYKTLMKIPKADK